MRRPVSSRILRFIPLVLMLAMFFGVGVGYGVPPSISIQQNQRLTSPVVYPMWLRDTQPSQVGPWGPLPFAPGPLGSDPLVSEPNYGRLPVALNTRNPPPVFLQSSLRPGAIISPVAELQSLPEAITPLLGHEPPRIEALHQEGPPSIETVQSSSLTIPMNPLRGTFGTFGPTDLQVLQPGISISAHSPPPFPGPEGLRPSLSAPGGYSAPSPLSILSPMSYGVPGLWLYASKKRSRPEIYLDILQLMKRGPMTPFEAAFYARLNHKRTKEYLEFLASNGYIEPILVNGKMAYALSASGRVFIEKVRVLFELEKPRLSSR